MFSIIIPTFNNLDYLKLCLKSIYLNSKFSHEIIIYVNDGSDGTLDFVKKKNIKFIHSTKNVGLCIAVNSGVGLATQKYVVYAHDDMYFCPGWDLEFYNEVCRIKHNNFYLSGTMIQPFRSFIYLDCGKVIENFNEKKLLENYNKSKFNDFQGSTWSPSLIPIVTWKKVNGFSKEFTYGLGSDPDLNMKLWKAGVRIFKGIGSSRVYHFGSISLRKKAWNDGHRVFLLKWGITIKFFKKYYLRSDETYKGPLNDPKKNLFFYFSYLICKIKFIYLKYFNFRIYL